MSSSPYRLEPLLPRVRPKLFLENQRMQDKKNISKIYINWLQSYVMRRTVKHGFECKRRKDNQSNTCVQDCHHI